MQIRAKRNEYKTKQQQQQQHTKKKKHKKRTSNQEARLEHGARARLR